MHCRVCSSVGRELQEPRDRQRFPPACVSAPSWKRHANATRRKAVRLETSSDEDEIPLGQRDAAMTAAHNTAVHRHVGGLPLGCATLLHVSYEESDVVPWCSTSKLTSALAGPGSGGHIPSAATTGTPLTPVVGDAMRRPLPGASSIGTWTSDAAPGRIFWPRVWKFHSRSADTCGVQEIFRGST